MGGDCEWGVRGESGLVGGGCEWGMGGGEGIMDGDCEWWIGGEDAFMGGDCEWSMGGGEWRSGLVLDGFIEGGCGEEAWEEVGEVGRWQLGQGIGWKGDKLELFIPSMAYVASIIQFGTNTAA